MSRLDHNNHEKTVTIVTNHPIKSPELNTIAIILVKILKCQPKRTFAD